MKADISNILRPETIASAHLADLEKSQINRDAALSAGIATVPPNFIGQVLGACNYGWASDRVDSLLAFKYAPLNGNGDPGYFRVKVFPPIENKGGRATKYLQPTGSGNHMYLPPGVDPKGMNPIYMAEGEKKSLCMTLQGFPCIGLPGVWGWKTDGKTIPDLDYINFAKRDVILVFDADIAINDAVAQAEKALAEELLSRKARVFIKRLPYGPGCAKGADDFILAHGVEAFRKLKDRPVKPKKANSRPSLESAKSPHKIVVSNRFLHDVSGDVIHALEAANFPPFLFVRSGMLTSIFFDEKGAPKISTLNETQLRGHCARHAHFFKEGKNGTLATAPPVEAVKDILHLGVWPFPALESIIESPALRSDGSILDHPGYDAQTRLYYVKPENLSLPKIPEKPSLDDVDGYLGYLLEAVQDFPFVEDADRANALGLIFSLPLRPAITGNVPMAVISAPAPGTGKSLLQDTVAIIGTGKGAPMAGLPSTDDEMRKFITSRLLAGDPFISFDNLEMPLWGPSLSRALTCHEWEDRVLGGNTTARLPQGAVWVANGNNLKLRGDLPRRTFPIRLDARLAKPWERENFKHRDLRAWVLRWRGILLAAILTITRAWFVAGKPEPQKPLPVMGGFESWAQTIGGILAFAGVEGFLENLSQFHDDADIEGPEWEAFLTAWVEIIGDQGKTCQEVTAILKDHDEFAEILPENLADVFKNPKKSFEKSLGRSLAGKEKRPYGEKSIALQRVGTHKRAILWKVAPLPTW